MNIATIPPVLTGFSALVTFEITEFTPPKSHGVFGPLDTAVCSGFRFKPSDSMPPGCSIKLDQTCSGQVDVTGTVANPTATIYFYLAGGSYTLIGIAFLPIEEAPPSTVETPLGVDEAGAQQEARQQVPSYQIQRDDSYSLLTVQFDTTKDKGQKWQYGLLVQQTSSGAIGIYDPTIENEE